MTEQVINPSIEALRSELLTLATNTRAFSDNVFSIFDLEELIELSKLGSFPKVGVAYLGSFRSDTKGNPAESSTAGSAICRTAGFSVIIAVQQNYIGQATDLASASNLLDALRQEVSGYVGINFRPWTWAGEQSEPEASAPGIAFYSQEWRTVITEKGRDRS